MSNSPFAGNLDSIYQLKSMFSDTGNLRMYWTDIYEIIVVDHYKDIHCSTIYICKAGNNLNVQKQPTFFP